MKIVYIVSSLFPMGEAYSSRARHLIKIFKECNYEVHVIAPGKKEEYVKTEDYSCQYIIDNKTIFNLAGFRKARKYLKAIKNYLKNNQVDFIISSNIPFVTSKIIKLSQTYDIPCILDQCEWFDSSSFKLQSFNPYYREHIRMLKYKNRNASGIIAISRLLEKHYLSQGMKVIRIPTILDIKNIEICHNEQISNPLKINIIFAGNLGKGKEDIYPMIKAVSEINQGLSNKFHLHFYGPNKNQIKENIKAKIDIEKNYIHIYGKISQENVENKLKKADYSFIIRPNRRSSNAGFPTKLAESLVVGTPVIANDTGDIGIYLKNGENGFLIENSSVDEIKKVLDQILILDKEKIEEMRRKARIVAEQNFDYKVYVKFMKDFLINIRSK